MRKRSKGAGSSPLTRGKRSVTVPVNITARLIPAHAGKTYCQDCRALILPAHPRSRGENPSSFRTESFSPGSSPLTRGKPCFRRSGRQRGRLIPAHAGKTRTQGLRSDDNEAHPRSRGENKLGRVSVSVQSGSSPLTRGKLECPGLIDHDKGLIPAHAGKTRCPFRARKRRAAHPRSRGENLEDGFDCARRLGSSPLTRGKPCRWQTLPVRGRLIPAHAGKTRRRTFLRPFSWAHPRSRGENSQVIVKDDEPGGSSPLTRGKLFYDFFPRIL